MKRTRYLLLAFYFFTMSGNGVVSTQGPFGSDIQCKDALRFLIEKSLFIGGFRVLSDKCWEA